MLSSLLCGYLKEMATHLLHLLMRSTSSFHLHFFLESLKKRSTFGYIYSSTLRLTRTRQKSRKKRRKYGEQSTTALKLVFLMKYSYFDSISHLLNSHCTKKKFNFFLNKKKKILFFRKIEFKKKKFNFFKF